MTDMTPGPVVEAATPGSGGAGVRESGEGSKTPVPPLAETVSEAVERYRRLCAAGFRPHTAYRLHVAGYDVIGHLDTTTLHFTALTGVQG